MKNEEGRGREKETCTAMSAGVSDLVVEVREGRDVKWEVTNLGCRRAGDERCDDQYWKRSKMTV